MSICNFKNKKMNKADADCCFFMQQTKKSIAPKFSSCCTIYYIGVYNTRGQEDKCRNSNFDFKGSLTIVNILITKSKRKNYVKLLLSVMVRFAGSATRGVTVKGSFRHVTARAHWARYTRAAWRSGCRPPTPATASCVTQSSPLSAGQGPSQR